MTCIVGLVHADGVTLGCDSQATTWNTSITLSSAMPKVVRRGDMLIGVTGTVRMLQLVRYALVLPEHPDNLDCIGYLATKFVDAVRDCFKNAGHAMKEKEQESTDGNLLIAYRERIFSVGSHYSITEAAIGYDTVGSGQDIALGSLHTSAKMGELISPEKRITWALEAAAHFNTGVSGPFVLETLANETMQQKDEAA